jgi:hypothetical protein
MLVGDYVPQNPYLLRKYNEKILTEIKTALKSPEFIGQDSGVVLRKIGKVQNLRRLEVLRKNQESVYRGRMQAIKTAGELMQADQSVLPGEESLLSKEVRPLLPKNFEKVAGRPILNSNGTRLSASQIGQQNEFSTVSLPLNHSDLREQSAERSRVDLEPQTLLPHNPSFIGQRLHEEFQNIVRFSRDRYRNDQAEKHLKSDKVGGFTTSKSYHRNTGHSKLALLQSSSNRLQGLSLPKIFRKKKHIKVPSIDVSGLGIFDP